MPTVRQGAKRDVRAEVLAAARKVLLEVGPRQATSADIAKRAQVSQTTMFSYFPDGMSDVLAATYDHAWGEINDFLMRRSFEEPSSGDPIEDLVDEIVGLSRLRESASLHEAAEIAFIFFRRPQFLGASVDSTNQDRFEKRIELLCERVTSSQELLHERARGLRVFLVNFVVSWFFAQLFSDDEPNLDISELRLQLTNQIFVYLHDADLRALTDRV